MLEGSKRRKVRPKERLLLQRVSWLPPWVGVGNSHAGRAPAGAPSVRGFENHASLRVRRAIKKIETQRHRAIASNYGHTGRVTGVPLPKAHPTTPDQGRRHVAHGPRCPRLHASAVEGSGAKRPVAKGGPITPCEGRCRRCRQTTRTRVAL